MVEMLNIAEELSTKSISKNNKARAVQRLIPQEYRTRLRLRKSKAAYSAYRLLSFKTAQLWAFEKVVQVRTHTI
jgi:hypothetical protein